MSPHANAMLSTLRRAFGAFYCRPCLSKSIRVAVEDLRTAWAELVAHSEIELNQAPCVECLQPRTVVRMRPGAYRSSMDATTTTIATLLLESVPNTYCYPCLAVTLRIDEKELRESARPLVVHHGYRVARRRCAGCSAESDLLQTPRPDPRSL